MSTFPAEIYGAVADFLVDIRPILLSCWDIYRELCGRNDAKFWSVRYEIEKAKIVPEKMYHLVKISPGSMILSGNVDLVKKLISPHELRYFPRTAIQSESTEMFDLIYSKVDAYDDIDNMVTWCCLYDNLYAMNALAAFTNNEFIVHKAAKYGAVSILQHFASGYSDVTLAEPIRLAIKHNRFGAVKLLHALGGNIRDGDLLVDTIRRKHYEIAEYLVENGARNKFIWEIVTKFPDFYTMKNEL